MLDLSYQCLSVFLYVSCIPVELVEPRGVMALDTSIFMPESTGYVVANFVHANWCLFTQLLEGRHCFLCCGIAICKRCPHQQSR